MINVKVVKYIRDYSAVQDNWTFFGIMYNSKIEHSMKKAKRNYVYMHNNFKPR